MACGGWCGCDARSRTTPLPSRPPARSPGPGAGAVGASDRRPAAELTDRIPQIDGRGKEPLAFAQRPLEPHAHDLAKDAVKVVREAGGEKGAFGPHEAASGLE